MLAYPNSIASSQQIFAINGANTHRTISKMVPIIILKHIIAHVREPRTGVAESVAGLRRHTII